MEFTPTVREMTQKIHNFVGDLLNRYFFGGEIYFVSI